MLSSAETLWLSATCRATAPFWAFQPASFPGRPPSFHPRTKSQQKPARDKRCAQPGEVIERSFGRQGGALSSRLVGVGGPDGACHLIAKMYCQAPTKFALMPSRHSN